MKSIKNKIINEIICLLKRNDIKREIKLMMKPIALIILQEIYPYIFLSFFFVIIGFLFILGIFILLLQLRLNM